MQQVQRSCVTASEPTNVKRTDVSAFSSPVWLEGCRFANGALLMEQNTATFQALTRSSWALNLFKLESESDSIKGLKRSCSGMRRLMTFVLALFMLVAAGPVGVLKSFP
jgi:hypothetical protein